MECLANAAVNLPNEIWVQIFRYVDHRTLLKLSLVCKHWCRLIFTHLPHRFQLKLDQKMMNSPQTTFSMTPRRNYKNLQLKLLKIEGSTMKKIFQELVPNVESIKLNLESFDLSTLIQILAWCPRINELHIKGIHFKRNFDLDDFLDRSRKTPPAVSALDLVHDKFGIFGREFRPCILNGSVPEILTASRLVPAITSLGLDVTNLNVAKRVFEGCLPNITKLDLVLHQPELGLIERLAPQLKVLKLEVDCDTDATEQVLNLRFPALVALSLKLHTSYKDRVLCDFLLGCTSLKTAVLSLPMCEYKDVFSAITRGLPLVEKLQISSDTVTSLEGLQNMRHLKEFSMKGGYIIAKGCYHTVVQPTVERVECHNIMLSDELKNVLKRFPNLRTLVLTMRDFCWEIKHFSDSVLRLKEITITIYRVNADVIKVLEKLKRLERIVINATVFAKSNFHYLRRVMVLPLLKSLEVNTSWELTEYVTRKMAAVNQSCALILNGETVKPAAIHRQSKRMKLNA